MYCPLAMFFCLPHPQTKAIFLHKYSRMVESMPWISKLFRITSFSSKFYGTCKRYLANIPSPVQFSCSKLMLPFPISQCERSVLDLRHFQIFFYIFEAEERRPTMPRNFPYKYMFIIKVAQREFEMRIPYASFNLKATKTTLMDWKSRPPSSYGIAIVFQAFYFSLVFP